MAFFRSYMKPGKGVDPDAPPKRAFFRFFEILGRKLWKMAKVNLLYAIAVIPAFVLVFWLSGYITYAMSSVLGGEDHAMVLLFDTILRLIVTYLFAVIWGMGPVTAGLTYIMRNYAREEHAWIWSDFKDNVKSNFKQSAVVFVIDLAAMLLMYFAYVIYAGMGGIIGNLRFIILIMGLVYTFMHFYIYPMMVTFELSLKDLYKNALLFALGKLPSNIFILFILLLVHIGGLVIAISIGNLLAIIMLLLLENVFLLSFSSFFVNFNVCPKMKKYMMDIDGAIDEKKGKQKREDFLKGE